MCSRELRTGSVIHACSVRRGLESDTSVGNALMAMYSTRGDRKLVEEVFRRTLDKDVVSWNTIVASYALAHDFDCAFGLSCECLPRAWNRMSSLLVPSSWMWALILLSPRYDISWVHVEVRVRTMLSTGSEFTKGCLREMWVC